VSLPKKGPATRLLYYEDAYMKAFEAEILGIQSVNERHSVVLDRTAFYPTGGGQPADTGTLTMKTAGVTVEDVQMIGETVLHVSEGAEGAVEQGARIKGTIDWDRRYALMRNHTAAHILGEAVRRATGISLEIVGSALNVDKARLDFAYGASLRSLFLRIEEEANRVVDENRAIEVTMMKRRDAEQYVGKYHESLKTLPPQVDEVRIVEVKDWHACACGGTHVKSTGELGVIKALKRASKGKGVERLEFSAGIL
jgi:alanyl-tRNA synthetase